MVWLDVPLEAVIPRKVLEYIDHLLDKRLHPSTINYHLLSIRRFYDYLMCEEGVPVKNPVKTRYGLRLPKPLPRCLKEEDLATLFRAGTGKAERQALPLRHPPPRRSGCSPAEPYPPGG